MAKILGPGDSSPDLFTHMLVTRPNMSSALRLCSSTDWRRAADNDEAVSAERTMLRPCGTSSIKNAVVFITASVKGHTSKAEGAST